jgi:hypothetical protein
MFIMATAQNGDIQKGNTSDKTDFHITSPMVAKAIQMRKNIR